MPAFLNNTTALAAILLCALSLFILLASLRPYWVSNSFLLLLCLLLLVMTLVSLAFDESVQILVTSFLIVAFALLLVPVLLIWNGVVILRRESGGLANYLPLLLGIVIAAGEISCVLFFFKDAVDALSVLRRPILFLIGASVFYASALLLAFVLYMLLLPLFPRKRAFEAVIVHGCALIHGDRVSRILSNRLDLALKLYRKSKEKAFLIVSGGKGNDETVSEAKAMSLYLREHGVPADRILLEDQSHSTRENLNFSETILLERGINGKVALVTSGYHVFRCLWIAHRLGFRCSGFGAPVAAYYWPSAVIREFVAVYSRKRYLLVALAGYCLLVVFPAIELFRYNF